MLFPCEKVHRIDDNADMHPELRLVIDHLALNMHLRDEEIYPKIDDLLRLASRSNVAVKASCMPNYASEPYTLPSLHSLIGRVVEAFGPRRVFWGSDLSRLAHPYKKVKSLFTRFSIQRRPRVDHGTGRVSVARLVRNRGTLTTRLPCSPHCRLPGKGQSPSGAVGLAICRIRRPPTRCRGGRSQGPTLSIRVGGELQPRD